MAKSRRHSPGPVDNCQKISFVLRLWGPGVNSLDDRLYERRTACPAISTHPACWEHWSIDALTFTDSRTLVVFQMTIVLSHGIKSHGLKRLIQMFPATIKSISIVFVIPEKRWREYSKSHDVSLPHQVKAQVRDLEINQFCLILTDEKMKSPAIHVPQCCVEEGGTTDDSSSRHDQDSEIDGDGSSVGDSADIEMSGI
ncbi:hypothetical protein HOY82DRAFT_599337 [Tuber indicum]|nr:hypothetical protein HOY82DRAFT_599337 [Tuber indicum]